MYSEQSVKAAGCDGSISKIALEERDMERVKWFLMGVGKGIAVITWWAAFLLGALLMMVGALVLCIAVLIDEDGAFAIKKANRDIQKDILESTRERPDFYSTRKVWRFIYCPVYHEVFRLWMNSYISIGKWLTWNITPAGIGMLKDFKYWEEVGRDEEDSIRS